ncbi:hypothetical protein [Agaribacterium sp. ZY112]|uniref:hypothetical protein n=1 Tax=Agaribacterium sp. ZY112 TaxID=3233574 RepID=UPI003525492C
MITDNHVSNKRRRKTALSLEARITTMTEIVTSGSIPKGFEYHRSDEKLLKWEDNKIGICKVGVNTARDKHPELWEQLQNLRKSLKNLERGADLAKKKIKSKTKHEILNKKREKERLVKKLTNELIMVRHAYLDLLNTLKQEKRKSKVIQDAIKRHHQHHGLQTALSDQE